MDSLTPDHPSGDRQSYSPKLIIDELTPSRSGSAENGSVAWAATAPLGELFLAMRSEREALREAAWEACYKRCWQLVWTRAFYVMRTVAWLGEPREMAADVTSDVFVGLPDAVRHYRETGAPEQWLKRVAVRTALRRREALTGQWSSGKSGSAGKPNEGVSRGRSYVPYDESAELITSRLDSIDEEERMELERRRAALRNSGDETKRRWDQFLELYVEGYDFREIGARMGLTEATARNWLCKIRKFLAQPLDPTERSD